ncbi:MAG TPA: DUF5670 family protein [Bacteroidia bacterium]|nr:DUF5670 family protein [Bacteroidia bacterium]
MRWFLYFIAILFALIWIIGVLAYNATGPIHVLLINSILVIILRVTRGKDPFNLGNHK